MRGHYLEGWSYVPTPQVRFRHSSLFGVPSCGMLFGFIEGPGVVVLNFIPRLLVLHVIAAVLT